MLTAQWRIYADVLLKMCSLGLKTAYYYVFDCHWLIKSLVIIPKTPGGVSFSFYQLYC